MKIILIFLLFLSSCTFNSNTDEIVIRAKIENIPAAKVYLADAYNWQIFLDSAIYKNDTFSFHIPSRNFQPAARSIEFINKDGKIEQLFFENYILSNDTIHYATGAFIVGRGVTTISGKYNEHLTKKEPKLKIEGSRQNDPWFRVALMDFGWISDRDSAKRQQVINIYKNLIKEYPYSYYFLFELYNYRTLYTKNELEDILSLFDEEAKQFSYYKKFSKYFETFPIPGKPLKNYTFKDSSNSQVPLFDHQSQINMIIFWASWCMPCREEIPVLKKIYDIYGNNAVRMVSVSIDTSELNWKLALRNENMNWSQVIIDNGLSDNLHNSFNFSLIPLIIFTNKDGLEISRFSGYDSTSFNNYKSTIEKILHKNK